MIIAISGSIGSGKDTVASMIVEQSTSKWENKKFAGKLKQIIALLTGCKVEDLEIEDFKNSNLPSEWDVNGKPQQYRTVLQKLGTELLRDGIHLNVHINALFSNYVLQPYTHFTGRKGPGNLKETQTIDKFPNWLITDLRFENEFDSIKEREGITVRIERYLTFNQWIKQLNVPGLEHYTDTLAISKSRFIKILQDIGYKNDDFYKKHLHLSETGLDQFYTDGKFDYVIKNDGTLADLKQKIADLLKEIKA